MPDRYRDSLRLFQLLDLLQQQGRTLTELRQMLQVSAATLRRDLGALRAAGFAIQESWGDTGKIVRCNSRSISLSPATAAWLLLTTLFEEIHGGSAESDLSVLRQAAAARLGIPSARLGQLLFHQPSPREQITLGPVLEAILDAIRHDRLLRIRYQAWGKPPREVRLAPWSLARLGDRLYLLGPSMDHSEPQPWAAWRVDRILSAEQMRIPFSRPAGWDPAQAYRGRLGAFHDDRDPEWISLQLDRTRGQSLLRARLPWLEQRHHFTEAHLLLDVLVFLDEAFFQWLMHLGADVVVLAPSHVRERMGVLYRELAARYSGVPTEMP